MDGINLWPCGPQETLGATIPRPFYHIAIFVTLNPEILGFSQILPDLTFTYVWEPEL